jgi:hypothetical protein
VDEQTEKFLRDGLSRYAEAQATVAGYESAAVGKVAEAVRKRSEQLRGANGKATLIANNFCKGDDNGRVAYAHFAGIVSGEAVMWETGIWWAHPNDGGQPAVYIQCMKGPDWLRTEVWAKAPASPRGVWEAYKSGLHRSLPAGADIDEAFARLFDEAADQVHAVAKTKGR